MFPKDGDIKIIESQIISFYFKLFDALKDNQAIQESIGTIEQDLLVHFFNSSEEKRDDFMKVMKIPVRQLCKISSECIFALC